MAKGDLWRNWDDGLTGGSAYPSSAATRARRKHAQLQLTKVLEQSGRERGEGRLFGYQYSTPAGPSGRRLGIGPWSCGPSSNAGRSSPLPGSPSAGTRAIRGIAGQDRYWLRDDYSSMTRSHIGFSGGRRVHLSHRDERQLHAVPQHVRHRPPRGASTIPTPAQMQAWFPARSDADSVELQRA